MVDSRDLRAVRALLESRRKELLKRYQAAGVGVGQQGDGYVIVIYLTAAKHRPREAVTLEGVPLKFEVTGPFKTANH